MVSGGNCPASVCRILALRRGDRDLRQQRSPGADPDDLAGRAGEPVADPRLAVGVPAGTGHVRAAEIGSVRRPVVEDLEGVRHRAARRAGRRLHPGKGHHGQSAHVEHVRRVGEHGAGVDLVALMPDVLHVVGFVAEDGVERHGVDDLAVRGTPGGVYDGEEVRIAGGLRALRGVSGPGQQPFAAGPAVAAGAGERGEVVGDAVAGAVARHGRGDHRLHTAGGPCRPGHAGAGAGPEGQQEGGDQARGRTAPPPGERGCR
jgi:hypothetical protein